MKRKLILIHILAICLLLSMTACSSHPLDADTTSDLPNTDEVHNVSENRDTFPISVSYSKGERDIKTGSITVTLEDARLVNQLSDIANPNGIRDDASVTLVGDSYEHGAKTIRYPDLIENGRLRTGCNLLVIDVSVTNNDAITYTKDDFDEDGIPQGLYSDPYLFHADGLFYLHDTHIGDNGVITHTDPDGTKYTSISCYTADYFSLTDNRPEDRTVFRVAHGETVSFSVGFLVFDEDAGGEYDLSTLYLTKTMGSQDFFAHLNVRE